MKPRLLSSAVVLALAALSSAAGKQYALNVPRVLLPVVPSAGVRSNFTLASPQGCFTWLSTKPDVASVEPLYDDDDKKGCSKQALLVPQSTHLNKLSSIIIAEEQVTGLTLRCDVFVNTISRVEITTRTRELLLEEEPERFEVQAYDDEGNMFSTLRGQRFDWMLLADEEATPTQQQLEPEAILNFIPFEDSTYSTDPIIGLMESQGLQGDTVLVAGMNTGTAKVQVKLVDRVWKRVRPDVVKLLVLENLMLQPSVDVYILPLSFVDYRVERRKQGRTEVVRMPSEQYSLELTNTTTGRLDEQRSRVTGLVIGYTEAVLLDKNMLYTPTATKPTAGIHVVSPHHLGFSIAPGNNWVLEVGRDYEITVHIFDMLNHKTLVTENVPLATVLPEGFLHAHFSSVNGSYHAVRASKRGATSITSTLSSIKHPETGKLHPLPASVSKQQLLEIHDPVAVTPRQLVLLWDPESQFNYQHKLKATGGSGNYQWSCKPEGVVGVSNTGTVTTVTKGKSVVTAADKKNTAHFDQTEVYVVPPAEMAFLPSRVEVVVGGNLQLPLQVKGYASEVEEEERVLLAFSDCRLLKLDMQLTDDSVFNVSMDTETDPSSVSVGACSTLTAVARQPGHTRILVSYTHKDILLEATVTIAAYPPLVAVDPETIAVVTLGSSKNFVFEGGPAPWILDRSKFYELLSAERKDELSIYQVAAAQVDSRQHVYRVVCKKLGQQTLSIAVGNGPSVKNAFPANETAAAKVSCALPVSMAIRPVLRQMPDCPLFRSTSQAIQFPVLNGRHLDLEVVVLDAESRPFHNFTSLQWQWGSSNENLLPTPRITSLAHHDLGALMTVHLGEQSGSVVVTATSNRHVPKYLGLENIKFNDPFTPGVNFSLSLLLRRPPEVTPPTLLLYSHPENKATLNIHHGSGHFRVDHMTKTRPPPAEVAYSSETHQVTMTPLLSEGQIKVVVSDLCLEVERDVTVMVVVAGMFVVEVAVGDRVQVGNTTLAFVRVKDSQGSPFPASQLRFMKLLPNPKSSHIDVKMASDSLLTRLPNNQISHSAVFVVTGITVGTTHLLFNATAPSGKVVSSWPSEIQVFDALKLTPKYITLLPTATFQVKSTGGPMPQTTIVYSITNVTVAMIDDAGLITAKVPGVATVTGQAQSVDPMTNQITVYSEDTVYLRVLKLTGIRIFVPSTQLLAGVEVAIYALGLNDEATPFTFASAVPGVSFHWSSSNVDVQSLASVYDKAGVSLQEEQDFSAILRTRNPGRGNVQLTAECHAGACTPEKATFTDHVQIHVLPPLKLLRPLNGHFLLPHNGEARIVTNRDGVSRMSYQLLHTSSLERQDMISVSPQGEIKTATVNGHAVVVVTEHEEELGLNQTVVVHIEVRPIASLSILPLSLAQATPNTKCHAFPLGYSAEFIAQLHDNIGRRFDYAEIPLLHRLNRFDIVRVSPETGNATYTVKAAKQGHAILKIWVSSLPHVADYVRVRVAYAIIPSLATVHLGARICFTTHLTETKPGWWSAGEEGIVQLQPGTGVGVASSTGRTVVYHKVEEVIDTHTEITVSKLQEILFNTTSFSQDTLPTFTNAHRHSEMGAYQIPVEFYHSSNRDRFSLISTSPNKACLEEVRSVTNGNQDVRNHGDVTYIQQVPFECILEFRDMQRNLLPASKYIKTRAVFNSMSGDSFCELGPILDPHIVENLATMDRLSLSIKARAFDFPESYELTSESLNVPFVPAFSLSRSAVRLSPLETSAEVVVTGLAKQLNALQVVSPYPISVVKTTSSTTMATYLISLKQDSPRLESFTDITVTFSTHLAAQESAIAVSYHADEGVSTTADACSEPLLPSTVAGSQVVSTPTPITSQPRDRVEVDGKMGGAFGENNVYFVSFLTVVAMVIIAMVICLISRQGGRRTQGGFSAHLPPSPPQGPFSPPHSPSSGFQTPNFAPRNTPPYPGGHTPGSSGGAGSAFKRPGFSPSPQHGLFSQ